MQEVVCRIEGCSICGEDTTYTLQIMDDGRIVMRVSGCRNWYNKKYKTGYVDGSEVTREEAMRLLEEHADDQCRSIGYYREQLDETESALAETQETIAELKERWKPKPTREEFRLMALPLLEKFQRS